jgi:acetyl-CoA carboxylase carboxyltransferase component
VTADWRDPLLAGATMLDVRLARRDPGHWPGYLPEPCVRAYQLVGSPDRPGPVAVAWDFGVQGGSFGEDDATIFGKAVDQAIKLRVPFLTLVRSGGTRLQEGMAALVGIPRARLALHRLAAAHLPHLSVADAPTTGGVWISIAAPADLRVAINGATVGFAGPRVVEAFTGVLPGPDSHTAESALASGTVDAVLDREGALRWLQGALRTWTPDPQPTAPPPHRELLQRRGGWEQVEAVRARTVSGRALLESLLTDHLPLQAPHADTTVFACVGRLAGRPVIGVALAAELGGRPTPNGFRLAARAYQAASRLDLPVLSLIDTPGADPGTISEKDGIAVAMGEAMDALLACRAPTIALVHGEGGSGGALAAAVADLVLLTEDSYFAAIGPEGATAALRRPKEECADRMGITPADLLSLGFADALADPTDVPAWMAQLLSLPTDERLQKRADRWSAPLPGTVS